MKTPVSGSLFNKVAGLRLKVILKKRVWDSCFPVSFVKVLRTPFVQNIFGRLLPQVIRNSIVGCNPSNHICLYRQF